MDGLNEMLGQAARMTEMQLALVVAIAAMAVAALAIHKGR